MRLVSWRCLVVGVLDAVTIVVLTRLGVRPCPEAVVLRIEVTDADYIVIAGIVLFLAPPVKNVGCELRFPPCLELETSQTGIAKDDLLRTNLDRLSYRSMSSLTYQKSH